MHANLSPDSHHYIFILKSQEEQMIPFRTNIKPGFMSGQLLLWNRSVCVLIHLPSRPQLSREFLLKPDQTR